MNITFDAPHLYYPSQHLPVWREHLSLEHGGRFLFYRDPDMTEVLEKVILRENLAVEWISTPDEAADCHLKHRTDWVILRYVFPVLPKIAGRSRSAHLHKGIGKKR